VRNWVVGLMSEKSRTLVSKVVLGSAACESFRSLPTPAVPGPDSMSTVDISSSGSSLLMLGMYAAESQPQTQAELQDCNRSSR
jgi:hypothetical protein